MKNCHFFHLEALYGYYDVILNIVPESEPIPDPELVLDPELVPDPDLDPDTEPDLNFP
jgi:hypothetical protein